MYWREKRNVRANRMECRADIFVPVAAHAELPAFAFVSKKQKGRRRIAGLACGALTT
jgi:hypothetical protein